MAPGRDPRRVGLGALLLATVYAVVMFVEGAVLPRVVSGLAAGAVGVALITRLPLPPWQETTDRRTLAARLLVIEAAAAVVIVTLVRLAIS